MPEKCSRKHWPWSLVKRFWLRGVKLWSSRGSISGHKSLGDISAIFNFLANCQPRACFECVDDSSPFTKWLPKQPGLATCDRDFWRPLETFDKGLGPIAPITIEWEPYELFWSLLYLIVFASHVEFLWLWPNAMYYFSCVVQTFQQYACVQKLGIPFQSTAMYSCSLFTSSAEMGDVSQCETFQYPLNKCSLLQKCPFVLCRYFF